MLILCLMCLRSLGQDVLVRMFCVSVVLNCEVKCICGICFVGPKMNFHMCGQ